MTVNGWLQIAFYSIALLLVTKPLGIYMLKVYEGSLTWLRPVERVLYRLAGVNPYEDQHWTAYAASMLIFSIASMLLTYVVLRLQHLLPLNPQHLAAVPDGRRSRPPPHLRRIRTGSRTPARRRCRTSRR
jgi:potassium-transporting ATPase potassium-binding subunit